MLEVLGLKYLFLFGLLVLLVAIIKSGVFKGALGEFLVRFFLQSKLPKDKYHILHNVTLPAGSGTTQIDHVVVSQYGVFVIETKNFKGWIFGGERQKVWVQKIYKRNYKFQNPIHQNYKHTQVLSGLLSLPVDNLFSVVVFVGNSTFKTRMPANVVKLGGLAKYILAHKKELYTKEQVDAFLVSIKENSLAKSRATNKKHVAYLQSKHTNRKK